MGNTQRLEVLVMALLLVIGMGVGAVLLVFRPPVRAGNSAPQLVGSVVATTQPRATAQPVAAAPPKGFALFAGNQTVVMVLAVLLVAVGGSVVVSVMRRRRTMPHLHQSMQMLLAHASAETRDSTLRVMAQLNAQGLLPPELQRVTGAGYGASLRQAWSRCLRLRLPRFQTMRLSAWRVVTIPPLVFPSQRMHTQPSPVVTPMPLLANGAGADLARHDASEDDETYVATALWSAEDRALLVAMAVTDVWTAQQLKSTLLAFDASTGAQHQSVMVWIDPAPGEEQMLLELPNHITRIRPTWRCTWRDEALEIRLPLHYGAIPVSGPVLLPLLKHGQRGERVRFFPLPTWRHLAIIGSEAPAVINGVLASVLYSNSPDTLALAVSDQLPMSRLFASVPHRVSFPDTPMHQVLGEALCRARGQWAALRRVLVVLSDPEPDSISDFVQFIQRVRDQGEVPVSLLLHLSAVRACDRELLALLPVVLAGADAVSAPAWLPGGSWPKAGMARFVSTAMRLDGKARLLYEAELAALLEPLATTMPQRADRPVIWQVQSPPEALVEVAPLLTIRPTEVVAAAPLGVNDLGPIAGDVLPADATDDEMVVDAAGASAGDTTCPDSDSLLLAASTGSAEHACDVATNIATRARDLSLTACTEALFTAKHRDAHGEADQSIANHAAGVLHAVTEQNNKAVRTPAPMAVAAPAGSLLQAVIFDHYRTPASDRFIAPDQRLRSVRTIDAAAPVQVDDAPQTIDAPFSPWPEGPYGMPPTAVGELMQTIITDPAFLQPERPDLAGITKNRLMKGAARQCLPRSHTEHAARAFVMWCDHAGLLSPSHTPEQPYRDTRRLTITDLVVLATRLTTTPLPTRSAVDAAFGER